MIDNNTVVPFDYGFHTDYGATIYWNARKGRSEYIRTEYIRSMGGYILRKRTSRLAEIVSPYKITLGAWIEIPFIVEWVYHRQFVSAFHDGKDTIVRYNSFDRSLI